MTATLPYRCYTDPEALARERELLFAPAYDRLDRRGARAAVEGERVDVEPAGGDDLRQRAERVELPNGPHVSTAAGARGGRRRGRRR